MYPKTNPFENEYAFSLFGRIISTLKIIRVRVYAYGIHLLFEQTQADEEYDCCGCSCFSEFCIDLKKHTKYALHMRVYVLGCCSCSSIRFFITFYCNEKITCESTLKTFQTGFFLIQIHIRWTHDWQIEKTFGKGSSAYKGVKESS